MSIVAKIATRHWKSLVGFNLLVLVAILGTVAKSQRTWWVANAQLILPESSSHLDANLGTLGSLTDNGSSSSQIPLKVQTSVLMSDAIMERVWTSDPERREFSSLDKYKRLFIIAPQEQSTIISVSVTGSSPKLARQRASELIETYEQRLNELRQANGAAREHFSQNQLQDAQQRLRQAQTELAKFKKSSGLIDSEAQTQGIVSTITTLDAAQAQAQAQALASENKVKSLSERLDLTPNQAIRSLRLGENQGYQFVQQKLSEVEDALVKARVVYQDDYPVVQHLLEQRQQLQRQIQQYIAQASDGTTIDTILNTSGGVAGRSTLLQQLILAEGDANAQRRQADQLLSHIKQLNTDLKSIPEKQAKVLELQRQSDIAEGVYKGLVAQVKQSNVDAFNAYPNVQVLDSPRVEPKPLRSPKLSLVAINALLASAIGSIALVLLLERRNPLLSPKDLQALRFPIVVSIPQLKHSGTRLKLNDETEVEFQRLASAISLQSLKNRRLLIASAIMGEGKTTVTLGLATALVDLGFRVLVVDGDFRQAELSHRLRYTQDTSAVEQPVQIQPGLDLLPTLPKRGKIVELVTGGRFEQALAAAQSANDYDYVLVDSAPVSLTSETALMAAIVPNVLFVVQPGNSYSKSVNYSLEQLTQHHAQILGLVVNGVENSSKPYQYRIDASLVES